MKILEEIIKRGFKGRVVENYPLSELTTYKTGGPAEILVEPSLVEDISIILNIVKEREIPLYIIGGGSKILAPDEGVRGIVMLIGDLMSGIEIVGQEVNVLAGTTDSEVARKCVEKGLSGLEWIADLPGRIGGSIVQNAGMNERTISDKLISVKYFRSDGILRETPRQQLDFGYRSSSFKRWGDSIIVSAKFMLDYGDPQFLKMKMEEIIDSRHKKFPVNYPSCGSVFKRPQGHYPGKLIEECFPNGMKIGGAMISPLHHNFIVNTGNAKSSDIRELIDKIVEKVYEKTSIILERELIYMEETRFLKKSD